MRATKLPARKTTAKRVPPPALFHEPGTGPDDNGDTTPLKPSRIVNGKTVTREEDVESPLPVRSNGKPVTFKGFRRLVFSDGTFVYGCRDCTFTCDSTGQMSVHRGNDHPKPGNRLDRRKKATEITPAGYTAVDIHNDVLGQTVFEAIEALIAHREIADTVVALHQENERLNAELAAANALLGDAEKRIDSKNNWRERALAAEGDNRRIHAALLRLGFVLKETD